MVALPAFKPIFTHMYKDAYPTHNTTVQITFSHLVVVALTLLVSFVLPAVAITNYRNQQSIPYTQQSLAERALQTGQVAGVSTSTAATNASLQSELLMAGALLLAGVAVIILIYLLITPHKKKPRLQ